MNDHVRDRVLGSLQGAVIGTELGLRHENRLSATLPLSAVSPNLAWTEAPPTHPNRTWATSLTALLSSVVEAYARRGGRIMPEDWGEVLKSSEAVTASKAFWLLDVFCAIELLREGMSARLTGQHTTPMGSVAAAGVVVGLYHAGDPDAAYVDGMEIASVVQRRPATDWAALLASAVSAAVCPDATVQSVVGAVLEVGQRRAPDVAAALQERLEAARQQTDDAFVSHYVAGLTAYEWFGSDPVGNALVLLERLGDRPAETLTVAAQAIHAPVHGLAVGALAGALHGQAAWPGDWLEPARPLTEPLEALLPVIETKLRSERVVVRELQEVLQPGDDGSPLLQDKVYGCILAGAIGNAMGSPAEGMLYPEVTASYGGPITTVLQPERLESEDDNQMAMLLVNTYRRLGGRQVTARDFGQTWMESMDRGGFWLCCRNVYDEIKAGLDPRIAGHWNLVTGSTVMCMEPVGIFHTADPVNAYIDGTMISYMEQRGLDVLAAAILSASVAEALRATATVDSVLEAALAAAPRTPLITFDRRSPDNAHDYLALCIEVAGKYDDVLAAFPELYEKCLLYHHIDPLELLGLSYAMFRIADGDVRQAAIGGASIGRDADTICGRAAMLSGALNGARAVPSEWIAMVSDATLQGMQRAAADLVALLGESKLPAMQHRQSLLTQSA